MTRQTCGYDGHYCDKHSVKFISRYRDENDYCVGGERITVSDDGRTSGHGTEVSDDDKERILRFERAKYEDYLRWRTLQIEKDPTWPIPLTPFTHPLLQLAVQ